MIFANHKFNKHKESKKGDQPTIRIYYFDLPVSREIPFDPSTKISDLISRAIQVYVSDNKLDPQKMKERNYQCKGTLILDYELRMLAHE